MNCICFTFHHHPSQVIYFVSKTPFLPLFFVDLKQYGKHKDIYEIKILFQTKVWIKEQNRKNLIPMPMGIPASNAIMEQIVVGSTSYQHVSKHERWQLLVLTAKAHSSPMIVLFIRGYNKPATLALHQHHQPVLYLNSYTKHQ